MKLSTLYRRAAAIMEHPEYRYGACGAIERAYNGETHRRFRHDEFPYGLIGQRHQYFGVLFSPFPGFIPAGYWWGDPDKEHRSVRVIALYFAAEIAASEGL